MVSARNNDSKKFPLNASCLKNSTGRLAEPTIGLAIQASWLPSIKLTAIQANRTFRATIARPLLKMSNCIKRMFAAMPLNAITLV